MGLARVVEMIKAEFDPQIDEKQAALDVVRQELDLLRSTREDRIQKARDLHALEEEKKRTVKAIKDFDPAVVAVFEAEAALPPE